MPGKLPISQQLENSFKKQSETDPEGFPAWLVSNGSSVAQTQSAANMQAVELAKVRLVGLIESNMKTIVESNLSNNQLDNKDAVSINKTIEVSSNSVSKKLNRVQIFFEVYRQIGNNTEVQVMIGYNYKQVQDLMLIEMKKELDKETGEIRKKFDKYLDPKTYLKGEITNTNEN